jgi:hypothetical protein
MLFFQAGVTGRIRYRCAVSTRTFKQQIAVQLLLLGVALDIFTNWVNGVLGELGAA